MAIAKELKGRTADELAEAMSESEFYEWAEFFKMQKEEHEKQMKKGRSRPGMGRG